MFLLSNGIHIRLYLSKFQVAVLIPDQQRWRWVEWIEMPSVIIMVD